MADSRSTLEYRGGELELFAEAAHWKAYVARACAPYLRGRVLEVGAGLGSTMRSMLQAASVREWTALEPDPSLLAELEQVAEELSRTRGVPVRAAGGVLGDLPEQPRFDAIVYIDVLEHILDDRGELAQAARRLTPGGQLVVLAPAHQALFSAFDAHIGHHRRYCRRSLRALAPPGTTLQRLRYLDCVGLLASLANRALLKRALPTQRQILVWDRLMIPMSSVLDPLCFGRLGKSILAVWTRDAGR